MELRSSASLMLTEFHYDSQRIEMIGTLQLVEMGKLLLATQLEYIDKQIEIENCERKQKKNCKQCASSLKWEEIGKIIPNRTHKPWIKPQISRTSNLPLKQNHSRHLHLAYKESLIADEVKLDSSEIFSNALITTSYLTREAMGLAGKQKKQHVHNILSSNNSNI